jgi:ectoine hydroxylase-related dioxygenase (phytanoyl-CoA dioxygenase family)
MSIITAKDLQEMKAEFFENGFLVLPGVLSPEECQACVAVMDELDRTEMFNTRRRPRQPGENLELRNCVLRAPEFMDLVDRPEILEILATLTGYNIQLGNSHAFIRPGYEKNVSLLEQTGFSWHYDLGQAAIPVNGRLPHLATRVGYFFTPLDKPDMGSISVVPGSHRTAGRPAWNRATDQPYGAVELLIDAGTVVIFDNRLWHTPAPNYSELSRMNLYLEYAPRWMRPFDYYTYDDAVLSASSPVRQQLLGHDFTDITDGGLGYQTGKDIDNPLKAWLEDRGLGDIPMIVPED